MSRPHKPALVQCVVAGGFLVDFGRLLRAGNVLDDPLHVTDVASYIPMNPGGIPNPDLRSILGKEAGLEPPNDAELQRSTLKGLGVICVHVERRCVVVLEADRVGVAEKPHKRRIGVQESALWSTTVHTERKVVEHPSMALLLARRACWASMRSRAYRMERSRSSGSIWPLTR